jgi:hypothetical protein
LVNILSAELKANLDVAQYGLGKKLEHDKNLAKSLYDIDIKPVLFKAKLFERFLQSSEYLKIKQWVKLLWGNRKTVE